jgi:uncharacterized lipoprotein YmbA
MIDRRTFSLACSAGALAACSSTSPPLHYYRLPSEPPSGEPAPRAVAGAASSAAVWELLPALPMRDDLARFVPGLWTGPTAPNVATAGRVQVELLALQGSLPRQQVAVSARWVVTSGAATAPRAYRADETVPWTEASPESLVVAQRVAMWRLAQRIAASLQGG